MKKYQFIFILLIIISLDITAKGERELFPDGSPIPAWFCDTSRIDVNTLGKTYDITDYGITRDSTVVQTEAIQRVIDRAAADGGGVIVIPKGTFLSGSLFFRQNTHLHLSEGATLKGSDDIQYYKIIPTRLEGQNITYFAALVNAEGLDGFTITGQGTIDGNGHRFWREFWIRRAIDKACTNLQAMRPRLVYIAHCKNVTLQDAHFINSPFWTTHIYKSDHIRLLNLYIFAPHTTEKAPSSDAIDLDVCHHVLIHGCYMSVNDDAVALKGGKGTWADKDENNGPNENIIIENCHYGFIYGALTFGSESILDRNILFRNNHLDGAVRVIVIKMRPDTPQNYEFLRVENVTGNATGFMDIRPWTQFYKPEKRDDMPVSVCSNFVFDNIRMNCQTFINIATSDKYQVRDFSFNNIEITTTQGTFDPAKIQNAKITDMTINNVKIKSPDYNLKVQPKPTR